MGNKIHENILVISGQELSLQRYKKFGIELHFKFVLLSWRLWSIEIKKKKTHKRECAESNLGSACKKANKTFDCIFKLPSQTDKTFYNLMKVKNWQAETQEP